MSRSSMFLLTALSLAMAAPAAFASEPPRPDISLDSPVIKSLQLRMEGRFNSKLKKHFNEGALGFTQDGLVQVRDASKIILAQRAEVSGWVSEENRDRKAVYREVAVANGHPEWEGRIQTIFASQWISSAHPNWWYQDASGAWKQK